MTRKKIKIKKKLHQISIYDVVTVDELNEFVNNNPGFDTYFLELEENDGSCGCYHGCDCNCTSAVLYGGRLETSAEQKTRLKDERAILYKSQKAIKQRELAELERLKNKYSLKTEK